VAYDEDLANRVRELLGAENGLSEVSMFGGLAFLLDGNMSVAVSSRGGLLLRLGPQAADAALARPHTRPMEMRGRPMRGWIRVADEGLASRRQLQAWVRRAVDYVRTLPPKG
jgi:TfoX/Sxy family transcriptional regulator of competence genes